MKIKYLIFPLFFLYTYSSSTCFAMKTEEETLTEENFINRYIDPVIKKEDTLALVKDVNCDALSIKKRENLEKIEKAITLLENVYIWDLFSLQNFMKLYWKSFEKLKKIENQENHTPIITDLLNQSAALSQKIINEKEQNQDALVAYLLITLSFDNYLTTEHKKSSEINFSEICKNYQGYYSPALSIKLADLFAYYKKYTYAVFQNIKAMENSDFKIILEKNNSSATLDNVLKTPQIIVRDIPLSQNKEHEELLKFKNNILSFSFSDHCMTIYNNDGYTHLSKCSDEANKNKSKDLKENKNLFKGNSISTGKDYPIGYFFTLPQKAHETKAIFVQVYGGAQSNNDRVGLQSFTLSQKDKFLCLNNIGILKLNMIDHLENDVHQANMSEKVFNKIINSIKIVYDNISTRTKLHQKIETIPQNCPIYLMGRSFGALIALRFAEIHPNTFNGYIAQSGAITSKFENEDITTFEQHLDVSHPENIKNLANNVLVMNNYNDNTIPLSTTEDFEMAAKNAQVDNLIMYHFFREGSLNGPRQEAIGHHPSPNEWYKKECEDAILNFIEKTKNGTVKFNDPFSVSIKKMRTLFYWTSYNQHNKKKKYNEKFLSIFFKLYQNAFHENRNLNYEKEKSPFLQECFEIYRNYNNKENNHSSYQDFLTIAMAITNEKKQNESWESVYLPIIFHLIKCDNPWNLKNYATLLESFKFTSEHFESFFKVLNLQEKIKNHTSDQFDMIKPFIDEDNFRTHFQEECFEYNKENQSYTLNCDKVNKNWHPFIGDFFFHTLNNHQAQSKGPEKLKHDFVYLLNSYKNVVKNCLKKIFTTYWSKK